MYCRVGPFVWQQKGEAMECIEIVAGGNGHSQFRHMQAFEVNPVSFNGVTVSLSSPEACGSVLMHEFDRDYFLGWHNPPSRQYVFVLAGELEIAVEEGGVAQRFAAGTVFIAGDLHGKGHTTRAIQAGRALVVNL
jgi:quercetin dioxygenase-like cupin family protein